MWFAIYYKFKGSFHEITLMTTQLYLHGLRLAGVSNLLYILNWPKDKGFNIHVQLYSIRYFL